MSVDYPLKFEADYAYLQSREDLYLDDMAPTASMEKALKRLLYEAWIIRGLGIGEAFARQRERS